jgi:hypothetical protein
MTKPIDLEALRVSPEMLAKLTKAKPARPKKWRRQFVQVPWLWVECLRGVRAGNTYRLALLLLYEHWRTGGHSIAVSNVAVLAEGLSRRAKWRSIAELERLGLIKVQRHRSRAPRISLRHVGNP